MREPRDPVYCFWLSQNYEERLGSNPIGRKPDFEDKQSKDSALRAAAPRQAGDHDNGHEKGIDLAEGRGGTVNEREAIRWFALAAENGLAPATGKRSNGFARPRTGAKRTPDGTSANWRKEPGPTRLLALVFSRRAAYHE
jgi:hypothetical protein